MFAPVFVYMLCGLGFAIVLDTVFAFAGGLA